MAKPTKTTDVTKTTPPAEEPKEVATTELTSMFAEDAGEDLNFSKEDLAIPFLKILQQLSPQCNKRDSAYIEGAEPGKFFNTVNNQIWPGDTGVVVIPVVYQRSHVEFKPRKDGGGFVKDWGEDDSLVNKCIKGEKGGLVTPDGNELVVSGLYYVLLVDEATGLYTSMALALSSTQLKKSRKWNTVIAGINIPGPGGKMIRPAMFYMSYKLTSEYEENDQGNWYGYKIEPYKPTVQLKNGQQIYLMARDFKNLILEGGVQVKHDQPAAPADDPNVPF